MYFISGIINSVWWGMWMYSWETSSICLYCGTWLFRSFNYNFINTTYILFLIFFFKTEKCLFKFPRIKLWGYGTCLFSFLSIRMTVNRKSFREPVLRARDPIASLLLIIQLWQVVNPVNLPELRRAPQLQRSVRQEGRGSLYECQLYCCANKYLPALLPCLIINMEV